MRTRARPPRAPARRAARQAPLEAVPARARIRERDAERERGRQVAVRMQRPERVQHAQVDQIDRVADGADIDERGMGQHALREAAPAQRDHDDRRAQHERHAVERRVGQRRVRRAKARERQMQPREHRERRAGGRDRRAVVRLERAPVAAQRDGEQRARGEQIHPERRQVVDRPERVEPRRRDRAQQRRRDDQRGRDLRERALGDEQHDERPEDVELLLDGERPQHVQALVPDAAERQPDIGREERVPRPVPRPFDAEQDRRDDEQQQIRRHDAAHAACVEIAEVRFAARLALEQDAGDQQAAQHEEQVNADP